MLSDRDIIEAIQREDIQILIEVNGIDKHVIGPDNAIEQYAKGALQPHGYDLRALAVRQRLGEWTMLNSLRDSSIIIHPGQTIEIKTLEKLRLGKRYSATIHSMVRVRKIGLSAISTTVHPGWGLDGESRPQHLEVLVTNLGNSPAKLAYRDRFCRMVFYELKQLSERYSPTLEEIRERQKLVELAEEEEIQNKEQQRKTKLCFQRLGAGIFTIILSMITIYFATLLLGIGRPLQITTLLHVFLIPAGLILKVIPDRFELKK